jgi:tRNA pseudouridine13 synthase
VLAEAGLALDDFARVARIAEGTRRDGAVALADVDARLPDEPDALDVSFTLPAGAYATVVMREICKSDVGTAGDSPEASA